ncbi:regulatory protein GemA [Hydrogenovibrio sp. 3SP14C1]|uniref:gp16 family protein n=1 Tax=Hydrogenovibrio sp. 3SP14C1 TaxID=3038774 RepID=UPI002417415A|nr:regulatory protein GemA [Hydrogenovibrio sp. 3SP14C1]MDG4811679.1 regulatory protein GemA [Hydrogenovibrio sp. 3SP14C1]
MSRQSELAQIHIAKKDLGMEDDAYRAMLKDVAGVKSSSNLDFQGRHAVIHRMKELGWKPKRKKQYGPKSRKPTTHNVAFLGSEIEMERSRKSQGDKIRALWIEMAEQKIVKNSSEVALRAYIKRMTKGQYEAPQFCDAPEASMIIESLKRWQKRELDKRDKEDQNHV